MSKPPVYYPWTGCRQMYRRIINHLMRKVDRLGLAGDRNSDLYELRVASYVASILSFAGEDGFTLSEGISKKALTEKSDLLFNDYCAKYKDLSDTCHKIQVGLLWDANIIIDRSARNIWDGDECDFHEAPIGLTDRDRAMFEQW